MKNIHVISTSKPSKLLKDLVDKTYQFKKEVSFGNRIELPLNIYITSDEEIVLNCYHFNSKYGDEPQKTNQRDIDSRKYWEEEDYYISKIILTTDQALIKDGVQAIDDEFLEWFVKNPSCERVEVVSAKTIPALQLTGNGHCWWKITIPKEEPKQECMITKIMQMDAELAYKSLPKQKETLEEASFVAGEESFKEFRKGILEANRFDFVCGFTAGAKWQQEQDKKLYSEEEVRNIVEQTIEKFYKHRYVETKSEMKELWFQQFKKK
jgi:hypothetical protein